MPATYVVNTIADNGSGSLRQAVIDANNNAGADTVEFDSGVFNSPKIISLTSGDIAITESVAIVGTSKSFCTVDGNKSGRIFTLAGAGGFAVSMDKLTLTNGKTTGLSATDGGGAVSIANHDLTLTNSTLSNNLSEAAGGAIVVTSASGKLTVADSTLNGNSSYGSPGPQVGAGGAISCSTSATVILQSSTITGNVAASSGGGVYFYYGGTFNVSDSTIDNNTANGTQGGGGLYFFGYTGGTVSVVNSTISTNKAPAGDGGGLQFYLFNGTLTVENSTIYNNTASNVGGGFNFAGGSPSVTLSSTIVSGDSAAGLPDLAFYPAGGVVGGKNNLIGEVDVANFTLADSPNQFGTPGSAKSAQLNGLANNGGATLTHLPLPGSPVIDNGNNDSSLTFDQRGANRVSGSSADVGSVEVNSNQPGAVAAVSDVLVSGGTMYVFTVTYTDNNAIDVASLGTGNVTVTGPNGFSTAPTFNGVNNVMNGTPRIATYSFTPPTGSWTQSALGNYSVNMVAGTVFDTDMPTANSVAAGVIGTFQVLFPASYVVNSLADENDGNYGPGKFSLREAISLANANSSSVDVISFDPALFPSQKTITLSMGQLAITDGITINGPGASLLTISGGNNFRVFDANVAGAATITLTNMTIANGKAPVAESGGAVRVDNETLAITDAVVRDSKADVGGGVGVGPLGVLKITNSTISGNSAQTGGGVYFVNQGSFQILGSTISGNQATGGFQGGGGLYFFGTASSALSIVNSTISSNNSSVRGGGILLTSFTGSLNFANSTIFGNSATSDGGGVAIVSGLGTMSLSSTIVAGNTSGPAPDIYFGSFKNIAGNNNLVGAVDPSVFALTGSGNQSGTIGVPLDAKLGALGSNGGPTQTHAPVSGSPVIDNGNNDSSLTFDQRGAGYNRVAGMKSVADVGAYEVQNAAPPTATVTIDTGVQKSVVRTITVVFSTSVAFPSGVAAAFQVSRLNTSMSPGPTGVVTLATPGVSGDTVTLTFNDASMAPMTQGYSLIDGQFEIKIFAANVLGAGGQLDGDGNGTGGDDKTVNFHRLYGDSDGSGEVTLTDFGIFRSVFQPNYNVSMDYDLDGTVGLLDFGQFRSHFQPFAP